MNTSKLTPEQLAFVNELPADCVVEMVQEYERTWLRNPTHYRRSTTAIETDWESWIGKGE